MSNNGKPSTSSKQACQFFTNKEKPDVMSGEIVDKAIQGVWTRNVRIAFPARSSLNRTKPP